ncbi:uncharacterized protein A1O9_09154 [Exophiala aquamarina CBS 119918]|uniref:DNA-directed RNA polymerase III subunit RPC3 n=1 Tax=Exophiala aquamarina CBS 119918 TaxID=1182545 RepID=A0A072P4S3_9EURO|nr:uncharacterized protein A1O9_09154 [Exophiala aquamarina CBS 119918]KEF54712.1 hypothetical protein A1O9_09154 [Exophiala aquamarina CBS 119918]
MLSYRAGCLWLITCSPGLALTSKQRFFEILCQKGRLSAPQIAQKCRLPLRQVKSALAALIQLRLIYHHTNADGLSTYQANQQNAYPLLRAGRLIQLARESGGPTAAETLRELTLLGYATVQELEVRVCRNGDVGHTHNHSGQVNGFRNTAGISDPETIDSSAFRAALVHLIDNRYITKLRDAHFQSIFDARQEIERHLNSFDGSGPTAKSKKAQSDQDAKALQQLKQHLDDTTSADVVLHELSVDVNDGPAFGKQTLLSVNYSNLTFVLRNQLLARAAGRMFGQPTAQVAKAAAKQIDLHLHPLGPPSPTDLPETPQKLDIDQILDDVHFDDEPLRNTRPSTNGWSSDRHVNGFHSSNSNGVHHRTDVIRHLEILAEGAFSFFEYNSVLDEWFVHKKKLSLFLRDQELMRLVAEGLRVDDPKLRIVRMLSDKGKLDEKNLQEIGLLNAKELRQSLASLQSAGLLELQEVPREPQRQPNRTIFLWFYDAERVQKMYLNKLYKSMSRLFQRLEVERDRIATTLTKIERTDVQGLEEDILSVAELKVLSQWRQREAWFMAEVSRIDDAVSILRDL